MPKKSSKADGDVTNPKGVLGKDDFLKLLLTELQYQDPTEPMDTEKILAQTSQLATLESSNNTNKALSNLAKSFTNSQQFSTISAIGKIADLGDDTIIAEGKGKPVDFDMYIPSNALSGTVSISDSSGNMVDTITIGDNPKGVYQFTWNGKDSSGNMADAGTYHISATYLDSDNQTRSTKVGTYPIDSVKFDGETTLLGVGSKYVPLSKVVEVY
ncbi:flagellar hook capping protein [bacterium]|nr:flagellar hook capping protein [bacterium]MBU1884559.1 flagellar hook capping protein [bacterium]